jgi:hypothetical protein
LLFFASTLSITSCQKTPDQFPAELFLENERLRRQLDDAYHERDEFKKLYLEELARNVPQLTEDELAHAVAARPVIEILIQRLKKP